MTHKIDLDDPASLKLRTPDVTGELRCPKCPSVVCSYQNAAGFMAVAAEGWIDEIWPTEGGGSIRVTLCPGCRRRS